jgi:hypothetical protein
LILVLASGIGRSRNFESSASVLRITPWVLGFPLSPTAWEIIFGIGSSARMMQENTEKRRMFISKLISISPQGD